MIQYYISYKTNDKLLYLIGITFYKEIKWDLNISKVKLFNSYPKPFLINDIIEYTKLNSDMDELKKENINIHKIEITEYTEVNKTNLKDKWL